MNSDMLNNSMKYSGHLVLGALPLHASPSVSKLSARSYSVSSKLFALALTWPSTLPQKSCVGSEEPCSLGKLYHHTGKKKGPARINEIGMPRLEAANVMLIF